MDMKDTHKYIKNYWKQDTKEASAQCLNKFVK